MALPFTYAPVLQSQAEVGLSARLHQVTEVVAVVGIAPEHVVGVARHGAVGLHLVVGLWLLLAGLHLVHGASFEFLTLLLLLGQVVKIAFVLVFREGEPVHHVAGIVQFEEGLQQIGLPGGSIHHLCL